MDALEHLERIRRLDAYWAAIRAGGSASGVHPTYTLVETLPDVAANNTYDLVYAGGGLGLIHVALMAKCYGLRVLVFDQVEVGCAHREWNISREELQALVDTGFCSWDDLQNIIMTEYETGVVRFYDNRGQESGGGGQELWLPNVLNLALDAGALLRLARRVLQEHGGQLRDYCRLHSIEVTTNDAVRVALVLEHMPQVETQHLASLQDDGVTQHAAETAQERIHARLLIDGMGSSSPLTAMRFGGQPFAGVCPTVGTVVSGLEPGHAPWQHNPRIGDILLTIDDAQRGQQYMWEGFPGRGDELTVYLFYYDTLSDLDSSHSSSLGGPREHPNLLALFEDYFQLLSTYKRPGPDFRHLKPVYGYIPARHSMQRQEAPLLRGILPIGDAAAQQSPLTFCGFGSHIRNLGRTSRLLHCALRDNLTRPEQLEHVNAYQANVAMNWVMSRFMQPWNAPDSVNKLQNMFLDVLNELGIELAMRFYRDQMRWGDYHRMILGVFRKYPRIVLDAWQVLGARGIQHWIADYLRFSWEAALASGGRCLGARGREALLLAATKHNPGSGLAIRARIEEWRVMGWLE